jgi:DNA-binding response OmpR family regulator
MSSSVSPVFNGRILLYDVDKNLAEGLCESLKGRGYLCTAVHSAENCIREINSSDTQILFIGETEDELKLFDVVRHAQNRGIDVHTLDKLDYQETEKRINKTLHQIESTIIIQAHKPR